MLVLVFKVSNEVRKKIMLEIDFYFQK